jgi:mono/diheme cytochrome c family protein
VTEIPEHLLKRSQQARSKASGESAPAESAPATTSTSPSPMPATPAAAAAERAPVAPAPAPVAKPDPPYIAAAKRRPKIPFWAMATLSILPLWVFMYARSLTPVHKEAAGPLGAGTAIFAANCSSCHGAAGEGGIGYPFAGGEVLKTFPHIEDQLRFVYNGTDRYAAAGITVYGDPDRAGGVHNTGARGHMPAFGPETGGALTEAQILAVVCHERFTLAGEDPTGENVEEYDRWCSPDSPAYAGLLDGTITFTNAADQLEGAIAIGTEPAAVAGAEGGRAGTDSTSP